MSRQVLTDEQTLDEVIGCLLEYVSIDMQGEFDEETVLLDDPVFEIIFYLR